METIVEISSKCYNKIILHALKNPTSQIHGILLGKSVDGTPIISIEDILPVFHSAPTKPIIDMSFRLADNHCEAKNREDGNNSINIIGWYSANEKFDYGNPSQVSLRVMSFIGSKLIQDDDDLSGSVEPILILLNNSKLEEQLRKKEEKIDSISHHALQVYGRDNRNNWLRPFLQEHVVVVKSSIPATVYENDSLEFFDFEDHLDSSNKEEIKKRDWILNSAVDI